MEALFRIEDDRFEADLLIETNRHCIGSLTVLLQELEASSRPLQLKEGALSAVDWRAIRRLYAGKGVDRAVRRVGMGRWNEEQLLIEAPQSTIPHLIRRMKKKEEQWIKEKEMLEEVGPGGECDVEMERNAEDQLL